MYLDYALYKINTAISDCITFREEREAELYEELIADNTKETAVKKAREKAFEEFKDTLTILKMDKEEKIEELALVYKNFSAQIKQIEEEIEALNDRKAEVESRKERIESVLRLFTEEKKFESARAKIAFRKSEAVEIKDINLIPDKYKRVSFDKLILADVPENMKAFITAKQPEACRAEIKKELKKDGGAIPGAVLVSRNNIQIK